MAPRTGDGYRTPIPKREIEARATGSGPVITYKLSPEELERYRAMPVKQPRNSLGERINRPVAVKQNFALKEREEKNMSVQTTDQIPFTPSKAEFLQQIAAGKSINKLEKEWKMGQGSLHYWIRKWDLKGIKPDRAKQLLDEMKLDGTPTADKSAELKPAEPSAYPTGGNGEIERLRAEIELLRATKAEEKQKYTEEVTLLRRERDDCLQTIGNLENKVSKYELEVSRLKTEIEELTSDRQVLLATLENAADTAKKTQGHDPVNHPAHYTAGSIECIDAIEAATTGLTGGLAYNTGAAIKYLWRWFRKNGVEDLKKARWYIDRLIGEVEGKVG